MTSEKPLVTIGLPVYNGENYLAEALDALLAQTWRDFEIVISDNGSSDNTPEICRAYAKQDERIHYHRYEQNRGAAWNYNNAFELAQGSYFKWAAHDDLCLPEYLARCVEVLDANPEVVLCYPKVTIIDEVGNRVGDYEDDFHLREPQPQARLRRFFHTPTQCHPVFGLMRTASLGRTGLIGNYPGSDRILLAQLVLSGQVYEVEERLFQRRIHAAASVLANADYNKRAAWFDPTKGKGLKFPQWRWFYEYLISVQQADLAGSERLACYGEIARWFSLHPKWMVKDVAILILKGLGIDIMSNKVMNSVSAGALADNQAATQAVVENSGRANDTR